MHELFFAVPDVSMRQVIEAYRHEYLVNGENVIYGGAWMERVASFQDWLQLVRANADERMVDPQWVRSDTMCVFRKHDRRLVGMVDIHQRLNDFLRTAGGHISYGVRPSMRNRGYGTQILDMALAYCADIGIECVMLNCARDNIAALRTIEKNQAQYDGEFVDPAGHVMCRYLVPMGYQHGKGFDAVAQTASQSQLILPDGQKIIVRSVQNSDAAALARLFRQTERESIYLSREPDELRITQQEALATIQQVKRDPKRHWLVALAGDELIGRCSVNYSQKRERFMHYAAIEIELLRKYWNRGIGTWMLDLALGWAVENGYEMVQVYVNALDVRTLHLFEKFGFQVSGRIPRACRYPDATYADMMILTMQL